MRNGYACLVEKGKDRSDCNFEDSKFVRCFQSLKCTQIKMSGQTTPSKVSERISYLTLA